MKLGEVGIPTAVGYKAPGLLSQGSVKAVIGSGSEERQESAIGGRAWTLAQVSASEK